MSTNTPVLPPGMRASHCPGFSYWTLYSGAPTRADWLGDFVTDDFGALVLLDGQAKLANCDFWYSHRIGLEDSCHLYEQRDNGLRNGAEGAGYSNPFDALPAPLVAEITFAADVFGDTRITIAPDGRLRDDAPPPLYRVEIGGNAPLYLSHAQLAALTLAGQHLCGMGNTQVAA